MWIFGSGPSVFELTEGLISCGDEVRKCSAVVVIAPVAAAATRVVHLLRSTTKRPLADMRRVRVRPPHPQRRPSLSSWLPQPTPPSPSRYTSSLSSSLVGGWLARAPLCTLARSLVRWFTSAPLFFPRPSLALGSFLLPSSHQAAAAIITPSSHSAMYVTCASRGQGQSQSVSQ